MDFAFSDKSQRMQAAVKQFVDEHVAPREAEYAEFEDKGVFPPPFIEDLKAKARAQGLWNLFLPGLKPDEPGTPMSNLDYAPCAEIMGRIDWASEVFNCSAPDTGNMELLHLAASPAQKAQWLTPLLDGHIRSSFAPRRIVCAFASTAPSPSFIPARSGIIPARLLFSRKSSSAI